MRLCNRMCPYIPCVHHLVSRYLHCFENSAQNSQIVCQVSSTIFSNQSIKTKQACANAYQFIPTQRKNPVGLLTAIMEKFGFEVLGQCTPNKPKGKFASLENLDEAGKKIDLKHHPVFYKFP